jgi:PAS domain S-box-containing protein
MGEHKQRNLVVLVRTEAILGGLLAAGVFAMMSFSPGLVSNSEIALVSAVLGSVGTTYYLTLHQIIGRWRLGISAFILTLITAANFALIITATGGLDSPYYALWLLAIAISGVFGGGYTVGALLITLIYYAYNFLQPNNLSEKYLADHIIQLIMTLVAALLGEWLHSRNRDIKEERSQLEAVSGQLSAEQLKSQTLITSLAEGVVVVDPKRRVQLFNHAAAQLTGWDETAAVGLDYLSVLKLETTDGRPARGGDLDPFMQAWGSRQTVLSENLMLVTRAGRKLNLRLAVSPILDSAGRPTGEIGLLHDISDDMAVERQKDEFVSTASHEMRTPIAAIEGYLSLALNEKSATIDARARKYLESAHASIGHLGQLFRDLLSVTKAETAINREALVPVNINQLLTEAVNDMQFSAQAKHLALSLQTSAGGGKSIAPLYYVAGHPERLREVVMNLIDNAIKYTPAGSVQVLLGGNETEVHITVADTGLGISADDIAHLFQKFYRVDSSETRTIGGTGLGLYLCRRVVELHNGRVWAESDGVGKGSRFSISLPRLRQEEVERLQSQAALTVTPEAADTPNTATPAPAAPLTSTSTPGVIIS